jgi:sterol desaturase/sphingolipid hydroxylase (fatty acid hydroxylase superfamily)
MALGIPEGWLYASLVLPISYVLQIVLNLMMYAIYHAELDFFERYKINPNPWPWKVDKKSWTELMKKTVLLVAFNNLVILPIALVAETNFHSHKMIFRTDLESLPDCLTLLVSIPFFMLVEDFTFSCAHWFLHRKWIYPYIHKIHHTHVTPVGLAAEYAHPLEFLTGNLIPTALGPALLGKNVHLYTVLIWFIVRGGETLDGHCGYEFSWSPYRLIPFSGSAEYHDYHHTHNIGNYSSFFSLWDTVWGTNVEFYKFQEEKKRAMELKQVNQASFHDKLVTSLQLETGGNKED